MPEGPELAHETDPLKEIIHPEVRELYEPTRKIIERMKKEGVLEDPGYDLVVGDDDSGRIPALVLHGFLKKFNQQAERPAPNINFFASSQRLKPSVIFFNARVPDMRQGRMEKFLAQKPQKANRALVVTDVILKGSALYPILKALRKQGTAIDVATISVLADMGGHDFLTAMSSYDWSEIRKGLRRYAENVFHPYDKAKGQNFEYPGIYGRNDLAGVKKGLIGLHSKRYAGKKSGNGQQTVNEVRADIQKVVEKLSSEFVQN